MTQMSQVSSSPHDEIDFANEHKIHFGESGRCKPVTVVRLKSFEIDLSNSHYHTHVILSKN